jgi:legume-like lectin family protein
VTFDPVMNTIGLATNGTAAIATINLDGTGIELRNENILQADLFYDGATLAVTITDSGTGLSTTASFAADIPELVGGSSAFVGFTGATGPVVDRYEWQPIFEWRYVAVLPGSPNAPPTIIRSPRLVELGSYSLHRLAQFQVRAADDAGPFNLRTQWELVSAPPGAKPRFEHFEPVNGNYAEFDVLGDYTFRVTVTDAQGLSAVGYTTYTVTTLS